MPGRPDKFYGQFLDYKDETKERNFPNMNLNDILNEKNCYNMIKLLHSFYFCGGWGNDMNIHLSEQMYLNVYKTNKNY